MDCAQGLTVYLFKKRSLLFIAGWGGDVMEICGCIEFLHVGQHFVPEITAGTKSFFN